MVLIRSLFLIVFSRSELLVINENQESRSSAAATPSVEIEVLHNGEVAEGSSCFASVEIEVMHSGDVAAESNYLD